MRIKRIYPKITYQELDALNLIIKLFNDIENTGMGIDYTKYLICVDTSGVGCKGDRLMEERIYLSKIIKILEENIKQADLNIRYLNLFLEYVVMDKSLKQLEKDFKISNAKDIIVIFTKTLSLIIENIRG